jgi:hypothetical protein
MADNTNLNPGVSGDIIRTLDKTGTGAPKTEVVTLDLGGGDGRSELISAYPIPAILADVPQDDDGSPYFSLSTASMDNIGILFRQLITALTRV